MSERRIVVLGGGGHAKVVLATLQAAGWTVSGVYDDDPAKQGSSVLGVPVVGRIADMDAPERAVIALGSGTTRELLADRFPGTEWVPVVHPRAYVHESVDIGAGTVIFAGAVVQPDSSIGRHVIVNTGATIDHDCRVEDFVHLGPGCHLGGGVEVGRLAVLSTGSAVASGLRIGAGATLGAGAAASTDIEPGATAVGVPAMERR